MPAPVVPAEAGIHSFLSWAGPDEYNRGLGPLTELRGRCGSALCRGVLSGGQAGFLDMRDRWVTNATWRGGRRQPCLFVLLGVCVVMLGACTDLRVSQREADSTVTLAQYPGFHFASAALEPGKDVSPQTLELDRSLRRAIERELGARGYTLLQSAAQRPALRVDYTVYERIGVNAQRLDSPSDYQRSWRDHAAADGTGSMDHTIADAPFNKTLAISVLLIPEDTGRVAWEGNASRSLAEDHPGGEWLERVVARMVEKMLAELPPRANS